MKNIIKKVVEALVGKEAGIGAAEAVGAAPAKYCRLVFTVGIGGAYSLLECREDGTIPFLSRAVSKEVCNAYSEESAREMLVANNGFTVLPLPAVRRCDIAKGTALDLCRQADKLLPGY